MSDDSHTGNRLVTHCLHICLHYIFAKYLRDNEQVSIWKYFSQSYNNTLLLEKNRLLHKMIKYTHIHHMYTTHASIEIDKKIFIFTVIRRPLREETKEKMLQAYEQNYHEDSLHPLRHLIIKFHHQILVKKNPTWSRMRNKAERRSNKRSTLPVEEYE